MSDQTPHQMPEAELIDCVIKLKQGYDPALAKKLIMHHRSAAFLAANLICKRHPPNRREDILASAMLGVVQGVRWISEGRLEDEEVTPYLVYCAYSFISKFIEVDRVIRVPRSALLREKLEKSGEFEGIPCTLVSQLADELDEERTKNMIVNPVAETEALCAELVQRICKTAQQRQVLTMLLEGRSLTEIGRHIGVSTVRVHYITEAIRDNYTYQTEEAA